MAVGTVLVTTPATSGRGPRRAARSRGGMNRKRGVDWLLLALVVYPVSMAFFFANPLVGTITGAALLLLFWPLISRGIAIARGRNGR